MIGELLALALADGMQASFIAEQIQRSNHERCEEMKQRVIANKDRYEAIEQQFERNKMITNPAGAMAAAMGAIENELRANPRSYAKDIDAAVEQALRDKRDAERYRWLSMNLVKAAFHSRRIPPNEFHDWIDEQIAKGRCDALD